ncbi:DUF3226 domain-containing protein [Anaeromicropila populeti]|uniref:DUF4276 family protein n=1 Tax=Anaeromicropila populeti TaxID=37658 RepID=A0A1I6IWT3_9FIRM|nr:DUF3226 domain-containing protein [Anaeromicropila populeti]SFR71202.1 hypothetical protein SAMN05661086_01200 [Anaeromicropila populeti]
MKTLILCEGTTDLIMLQFVLQYKYDWKYDGFVENAITNRLIKKRLIKDNQITEINSCGGITNISKEMLKIKEVIEYATKNDEIYNKIIIMIDHDTVDSNKKFIEQLNICIGETFTENQINIWSQWEVENLVLGVQKIELYIKCIPETETGAIESIMLNALGIDAIEQKVIQESSRFIEKIANTQNRYLQKKSGIYKAIFNTYFSIRTPEETYAERARILRAYDWKNNEILNCGFSFLNY